MKPSGIEEQLWPTVCLTVVLVGILGVIVWENSDFEEDRLLLNGYTHLAALGLGAALVIFIASRLKAAARRAAEFAIVFSLAFHAVVGVGAYYLFSSPLRGFGPWEVARDPQLEADDEPPPPDYHWGQNDEQEPEQAFEKAVVTKIREQVLPAAEVKPRNMNRPASAADITRVPKVEISPLGVGAGSEPSRPLEIRRPEAAKLPEPQTPETQSSEEMALVRNKADAIQLPKSESPALDAIAQAPKESTQGPEPVQVNTGKLERIDWATVGKVAAPNEPLPPQQKMPRGEVQPGEPLPSPDVIARLPSRVPLPTPDDKSGAEAADRIEDPGSSLARSNRDGVDLPSTVIPSAALPAQSPAAPGGPAPSRLEAASTVAVEKSDLSRAPLGPSVASNGAQDYATGSGLMPARRGAVDGRGKAQPSVSGYATEDFGEVRSGSPGSDLGKGLPLMSASARRAIASQTEDGGKGPSANISTTLPRTQSEMGISRPAAAKIVENSAIAGAGGTARSPGGQPSSLDVDQRIAVRRWEGTGSDSKAERHSAVRDDGKAEWHSAQRDVVAGPLGPSRPRHVEQGTSDGDDNSLGGISRARAEVSGIAPHPTATRAEPVAGAASASGTLQDLRHATIVPNSEIGGIERRANTGQGVGARPAGQAEPSEIAAPPGVSAPQSGVGRDGRGDAQLDQILAGEGSGLSGIGRGNSPVDVSGQVREPMAPFRRGAAHGGLTLGDSVAGQLTEPAIESGLEYFSHSQFNDGHWSLHESPEAVADPASVGSLHADTAATGLALLSYLAAGYTQQDEKYRDVVRRGVLWLMKHQQGDGNLAYHVSEPGYDPNTDPTNFYSHGIAAMALCEAYGMTQDRELRGPAQKAIDFIVKSQNPSRGGWRYRSQEDSDTSVTGWQLMALRSGQMAGLNVPGETLRKVGHWLDLAQVPNRGTYVYNPWNVAPDAEKELAGRAPSPTMTAQAMVMRMYLGQDHDQATLAQGADYLLAHLPEAVATEKSPPDCYYWYYATQAMGHMQGDYWKTWDARVTPLLRAGQADRGPLKGSWDPREPVPDRWSVHGGRHYVTAIRVLTLEFRYWHLPLFRELRRDE